MTNWYERLRQTRIKHDYSQAELAELIGVDETAISRYEKGKGSKRLTSNFSLKLMQIFSKDEIDFIEYGSEKLQHSIIQSGNGNIQQVGNGNHNTTTPYDINNPEHVNIMHQVVQQVKEEDMSVLDQEILEMLKFAPEAFKKNILAKLQEFKKMSEL